jgi:hypothetical protein
LGRVCNVRPPKLRDAGGRGLHPILLVNPRTDTAFATLASEIHEASPGDDPAALESRLREHYPNATVHVRVLSDEPTVVWYLYRDGHWTRPG